MRHRGVSQADLARTLGWHTSNLSRILSGKRTLSIAALNTVASALECTPGDLLRPVGTDIPPPPSGDALKPLRSPNFELRLHAILTMLGLRIEELLEFLTTGNYESLPAPIARRLRKILESR